VLPFCGEELALCPSLVERLLALCLDSAPLLCRCLGLYLLWSFLVKIVGILHEVKAGT